MPITKATASSIAPAAKGDLVVGSATNDAAVLNVGSNDQVLTADSSTATGLKWASPAGGGGVTLLSTTTLSGSSTTISSISGSYKNLYCVITGVYTNNDNTLLQIYFNSDTDKLNYSVFGLRGSTADDRYGNESPFARIAYLGNSTPTNNLGAGTINILNYADTGLKYWSAGFTAISSSNRAGTLVTGSFSGSTITSIKFDADGSTFSAGTVKIYGVN